MKAVDHNFAEVELPKPAPSGRDLLVKVEAVSVNPVDYKQRKAATSSKVLGWDAAGTVAAVGSDASLFKAGDEVYYAGDVTRPGCNSEFHLVDERIVGRKPRKLDFAQAAAMPLTSITAWEAFHDRMKVRAGKSILIINGAGGVGSIGVQLAKHAGLRVIATASRPESIAWVEELGADQVVDHRKPLAPQVKQVDYVANFSGDLDAYWDAMAEVVAPQGAVVAIVANSKPLAMDVVRSKSVSVCWELMFTRPRFKTPDMIEQAQAAQPGRRPPRRRKAALHAERDPLADQRRESAPRARAARIGNHDRQNGSKRLVRRVKSILNPGPTWFRRGH